jgi:serine/threonine protein phosphatase PrpC
MSPVTSLVHRQVNKFQTQPGDVVILSTDGLLDNLHEEHVVQVIPPLAARLLL